MRIITLSYQKNIRDLGSLTGFKGKKVKTGRLFRGGALLRASKEDEEILNSLNLTDIIDFRGSIEFKNKPDVRIQNVKYHNFSPLLEDIKAEDQHLDDGNLLWFIKGDMSGFEHMFETYGELPISETGKKAYSNFFKLLTSKEDGVFYFHCSQGKDRAGLAAYLLETALGVDEESKREDYLLSNIAMEDRLIKLVNSVKDRPYFDEKYHQSMKDVFSAKIEYLENSIRVMEEMSGSILNYLIEELGVDIDKLRELYLE